MPISFIQSCNLKWLHASLDDFRVYVCCITAFHMSGMRAVSLAPAPALNPGASVIDSSRDSSTENLPTPSHKKPTARRAAVKSD